MKYLVEDCDTAAAPVQSFVSAAKAAANVFARYPFVRKAVLFGSFSRGDERPTSDVDFFIGVDGAPSNADYFRMLNDLASSLGRDVDVTMRLRGATERFVANLKADGRLIYVRDDTCRTISSDAA